MNEKAHAIIFRGAIEALPATAGSLLTPHSALFDTAPNYPDYFDDPTRPVADKRRIDSEWERFTRFPGELPAQAMHFWPTPVTDQEHARPMMAYLLKAAITAWRNSEEAAAVKFLGCLSHYLGDVCQPAHLMDLDLLAQLLPRPDGFATFHYHTTVEAVTGDCGALQPPRLLGLSTEEAVWRLATANQRAIHECRQYLVPLVQALFAGDEDAARVHATPPVTRAAQLTADVIYTALVLATTGGTPAERQPLQQVDLCSLPADEAFHDLVYGEAILDGSRQIPPNNGPVHPAVLRGADGTPRRVHGLGVLPHSGMNGPRHCWLRYGLPAGTFQSFTAEAGLHAELGAGGAVTFSVELDGREVFHSPRLTAADAAIPINVALNGACSLTLKVEDANEGQSFWNNHAIWGSPLLIHTKMMELTP